MRISRWVLDTRRCVCVREKKSPFKMLSVSLSQAAVKKQVKQLQLITNIRIAHQHHHHTRTHFRSTDWFISTTAAITGTERESTSGILFWSQEAHNEEQRHRIQHSSPGPHWSLPRYHLGKVRHLTSPDTTQNPAHRKLRLMSGTNLRHIQTLSIHRKLTDCLMSPRETKEKQSFSELSSSYDPPGTIATGGTHVTCCGSEVDGNVMLDAHVFSEHVDAIETPGAHAAPPDGPTLALPLVPGQASALRVFSAAARTSELPVHSGTGRAAQGHDPFHTG